MASLLQWRLDLNWHELFYLKDGRLFWKQRGGSDSITKMWNARFSNKVAGSIANRGHLQYIELSCRRVRYYAHRVIWEMYNGQIPDGYQIDHIDGDGLNNVIENLRLVRIQDNRLNMAKPVNNTSGQVGVSYNKSRDRWVAVIQVDRKSILLGRFIDFEDAVIARKTAEMEHSFHPNHGRDDGRS